MNSIFSNAFSEWEDGNESGDEFINLVEKYYGSLRADHFVDDNGDVKLYKVRLLTPPPTKALLRSFKSAIQSYRSSLDFATFQFCKATGSKKLQLATLPTGETEEKFLDQIKRRKFNYTEDVGNFFISLKLYKDNNPFIWGLNYLNNHIKHVNPTTIGAESDGAILGRMTLRGGGGSSALFHDWNPDTLEYTYGRTENGGEIIGDPPAIKFHIEIGRELGFAIEAVELITEFKNATKIILDKFDQEYSKLNVSPQA